MKVARILVKKIEKKKKRTLIIVESTMRLSFEISQRGISSLPVFYKILGFKPFITTGHSKIDNQFLISSRSRSAIQNAVSKSEFKPLFKILRKFNLLRVKKAKGETHFIFGGDQSKAEELPESCLNFLKLIQDSQSSRAHQDHVHKGIVIKTVTSCLYGLQVLFFFGFIASIAFSKTLKKSNFVESEYFDAPSALNTFLMSDWFGVLLPLGVTFFVWFMGRVFFRHSLSYARVTLIQMFSTVLFSVFVLEGMSVLNIWLDSSQPKKVNIVVNDVSYRLVHIFSGSVFVSRNRKQHLISYYLSEESNKMNFIKINENELDQYKEGDRLVLSVKEGFFQSPYIADIETLE